MQLTQKGKIYALILLASAIFTVFSITFEFFPHLGLSISFIFFATLAFNIKKEKTSLTKIFFVITLILSAFLSIRSEGFITFLNIVSIFYFASLLSLTKNDKPENAFSLIFAPFVLFIKSLQTTNVYSLELNNSVAKEKRKENVINTVAVTLTTITVLAVILPLLSSANPFFEKFLSGIVDLVGLDNFKITDNLFEWMFRFAFFLLLSYFIPKVATFINKKESTKNLVPEGINILIPKIAVAIVLTIFFITQFQLYFSSSETLEAIGYTYSNYTNEVFAQLSAVAAIVLVLLYGEKENKKLNRKMALVLAIQGIFLTFMAYKSVYEYSAAWGFTYKRLYGFALASWILGIFTIYLYTFLKNIEKYIFLTTSLVYTGIILVLINVFNFDYIIYHFRRASTGQGVDYEYLSRLSSDSLSYKSLLFEITKKSSESIGDVEKTQAANFGLWTLIYKIERLQEKYEDPDFRGFNLLEYLQYKEIKDVNTETIKSKYTLTNPL